MIFGDLKLDVIELAGDDPETTGSGESELIHGANLNALQLKRGIDAALRAVCARVPKLLSISIPTDTISISLPVDLISIDGVQDGVSGAYIPKVQIRANQYAISDSTLTGNGWHLYKPVDFVDTIPSGGVITFLKKLTSDALLSYRGNWLKSSADLDVMDPPEFLMTAIALYAASYCLVNKSASAGNLRQYNTKVDSGIPTNNPVLDLSNFLLKRYDLELSKFPAPEPGIN